MEYDLLCDGCHQPVKEFALELPSLKSDAPVSWPIADHVLLFGALYVPLELCQNCAYILMVRLSQHFLNVAQSLDDKPQPKVADLPIRAIKLMDDLHWPVK